MTLFGAQVTAGIIIDMTCHSREKCMEYQRECIKGDMQRQF